MQTSPGDQARHVLLIDDNRADITSILAAFQDAEIAAKMEAITSRMQALRSLRQQEHFKVQPRLDIVLLDLNMPVNEWI